MRFFYAKKPTKAIRVYIMYIKKVVPVFRIINSILGRRHFSFHTSYSLPLLAFVCKFCIDFSYSYYEVEFSLHYFFALALKSLLGLNHRNKSKYFYFYGLDIYQFITSATKLGPKFKLL